MNRPSIQLALDLTDLGAAIDLVSKVGDLVDRIEVGTLLLRKHGVPAITALRGAFSSAFIVADSKVMDCGAAEVSVALEAGANSVVIQAAAPSATLRAACRTATQLGGQVMLDSLGIESVSELGRRLRGLSATHLIIHTGKDEQASDTSLSVDKVLAAARAEGMPSLAIAGGISPENIDRYVAIQNVDVMIVGNAVINSRDPRTALERIRRAVTREYPSQAAR